MPAENRLLVIGIDEYSDSRYQRMNNAQKDVQRFAKVLQDRYGFSLAQPPILNADATRENIIEALYDLVRTTYKEDNLIICYAGHGDIDPGSNKGYWIPIDGVNNKVTKFILNSTVIDIIEGIPAKHILLISDSCFSGTFLSFSRSSGRTLTIDELDQLDSRWVFASGDIEKVSDGMPGLGSPFSRSICEFLEKNEKPAVAAAEIFDNVIRTTEARSSQHPQAAPIICDANKGGQMIFRLHQPIQDPKAIPVAEQITFPLPDIPPVEDYIPRTVTFFEHQKSEIAYFFEPEVGRSYLTEVINTRKRIALLGSAGSGKTVELLQLSKNLVSTANSFIPVYKRFNTYTEEDIKHYLPKGWDEVNPEVALIILDGLDEVQPRFFNTAIRKIISFSDDNPLIRMIISCRTNFYELPSQNFSGTLEGFSVYMLNDVSIFEIRNYATNVCGIDGMDFVKNVYEALFADLIQKPYFLNILIKHFQIKGNFTEGRAGLMEQALINYYENNKEHFKATFPQRDKHIVFGMIERIAFVMEVLGKNFITDEELHKLFPNAPDFEYCNSLPAFKRNPDKDQWMFEHNNIQEYLASRVLSKEPFENLTKIVSIPFPGGNRVKQTWVNTLSFLVSIGEDKLIKPLLDWIISNDLEIIIRFEPDRLTKEKRIEIFKQVFKSYSDKQIWISSNKFSDKDLARFGQFNEILTFLLEHINNIENSRIVRLNGVHVLRDFDLNEFSDRIDEIKESLFEFLDTGGLLPMDIYMVLGALARLKITDEDTIARIVAKYAKHKNQYIRAGMYKLIHNSQFIDDYVDVFLDGIDLGKIEGGIDDRESVNLMDESVHLKIGLQNIKRFEALKKVIAKFTDPERHGYFYSGDFKEIISSLIQNVVAIYSKHTELFDSMARLLASASRNYNKHFAELILPFFKETGREWDAFIKLWKENESSDYLLGEIFDILFDETMLPDFLEEFSKGSLSNEDLTKLHGLILWHKKGQVSSDGLLSKIEELGKTKAGIEFQRPVIRDWDKINKLKTQQSFDLLFDKNNIITEVENIFVKFEKAELTRDDLFYMRSSGSAELEDSFINSAIDLVRDLTFGGITITLAGVKEWILEDPRFTHYQIEKIYNYLNGSHAKFIQVSKEQIEFIHNWCIKIRDDVRILWFFLHRFELQLSEDVILDLISQYFDFNTQVDLEEPGAIEQLEKFISKDKIKQRVIEDLKQEVHEEMIWISLASYAIRNNLRDSYPSILGHLEMGNEGEYRLNDLLALWFTKTNNFEKTHQFIEKASSSVLKWKAISLLNNSGKELPFLIKYFNALINNEYALLEDRFLAANYLMQHNEISGFNFTANYVLEHQDPRFDFNSNFRNLVGIIDTNAIPLLLRLLFLSKQKAFILDRFNSLEIKVLDSIYNIGVQSDESYQIVKDKLLQFINVNKDKLDDLNFLHFTIRRIEDQLNMKKAQDYSIDDAIEEFDSLQAS